MESEPRQQGEERMRSGVEIVYRNDRISIFWEPKLCTHVGNCFRGLPEVFKPRNRPWVLVDAASPDEIARVIMTCPTGALHFERHDGGPQEPQPEATVIAPQPDGPLYVRGRVTIAGPDGQPIRKDTRLALCRCGHSGNKPFCDGSHWRVRFRASGGTEGSGSAETGAEDSPVDDGL